MNNTDVGALMSRSSVFDPAAVNWEAIADHPLPADAARALRYMQDVESHTIIYLRDLLSTHAVEDPTVAGFLATWFYEETAHGRALGRFLTTLGHPLGPSSSATRPWLSERIEALGIACLAALWRDFPVVHMTWGAINELSTLTGYRRLTERAGHPVLDDLLTQIMRDESRHFGFYFEQAARRLAASGLARRLTRTLVDHFWDPVGAGVQPPSETRFLARYLFSGADGRAAAHTVDRTIRRLPGFEDAQLLTAWIDRHCGDASSREPLPTAIASCSAQEGRASARP